MNQDSINIDIATNQQTLKFFKQKYSQKNRKIYGCYSSQFDKIIIEEHLMLIPIDQRMATRAHGAFDVIYLMKLKLINLSSHIERLINSAKTVGIDVQQISLFDKKNKKELTQKDIQLKIQQKVIGVVKSLLKQLKKQKNLTNQEMLDIQFGIRMSISSGHGDFGIASLGKKPILYIYVFQPYFNYKQQKLGVNEYVVKIVQKINKDMVHTKSLNYFQNALMANQAKRLGAYQGIKALDNGVLLQASVANIFFIFEKIQNYQQQNLTSNQNQNKRVIIQFATPRFETVIQGTTIKKLLKDITIQQAQNQAVQMAVIGGDKIVPVLNFNGKKIGRNKVNSNDDKKIVKMCQQWYQKQIQQCPENIKIDL